MLEPSRDHFPGPPTATMICALWEALRMEPCTDGGAPVERLMDALEKTRVNGGAKFAKFRIAGSPDLDWFVSRGLLANIEFSDRFLKSPVVVAALPDVCGKPVLDSFGFEWASAFTLAGELAQALAQGGAYKKHEPGAGDAFNIAEDFRKWLFQDRFDEVQVLKSVQPWSDWFGRIAWDQTWLIVDKRHRAVSVLAVTDVD